MTPDQQSALESLTATATSPARALTQQEISQIDPLLDPDNRNDVAIADILSAGRTRPVHTEIGIGTVLAKLGAGGGVWLDALDAVGQQDANVRWSMVLIREGRFRIDMAESRAAMQHLATNVPELAAGIAALLTLGVEPDPLSVTDVSRALNIAEGRVNL